MEIYLIESRSIGGLSGSPVFVLKEFEIGRWRVRLVRLIHGHWDAPAETIVDATTKARDVNVGIAMVAPAKKILETINQTGLAKIRDEIEQRWFIANPEAS
jgi:hypothetical protein